MKILNASEPGLGSLMTEMEERDFLSNTKLFARLGTIDEKGDPNVHHVWYYFDNERIYFETGKNSKKVRNIKNRNNITFVQMKLIRHIKESEVKVQPLFLKILTEIYQQQKR